MKTLSSKKFIPVISGLLTVLLLIEGCVKTNTGNVNAIKPTVITGFNIAAALPNSVISVIGNNFDTVRAHNVLSFNGLASTIISVSSSEIVVTVPSNATTGKVKLENNGVIISSPTDFKVLVGTVSAYGKSTTDQTVIDSSGNFYEETTDLNKIFTTGYKTKLIDFQYFRPYYFFGKGMVFDQAGNLYLLDFDFLPKIVKITPNRVISIFAGGVSPGFIDGQGSGAHFFSMQGVTIDASGNLYVLDASCVRKVTPDGTVSTFAGNNTIGYVDGQGTAARFGFLQGITIDAAGNIYVGDLKNYNIRKITSTGMVTTFAGSGIQGFADGVATSAQFSYPRGLAADATGNIFVSDSTNPNITNPISCIRMINKAGVVTTLVNGSNASQIIHGPLSTSNVSLAIGITFDSTGNMYICNTGAGEVSKVTFN